MSKNHLARMNAALELPPRLRALRQSLADAVQLLPVDVESLQHRRCIDSQRQRPPRTSKLDEKSIVSAVWVTLRLLSRLQSGDATRIQSDATRS